MGQQISEKMRKKLDLQALLRTLLSSRPPASEAAPSFNAFSYKLPISIFTTQIAVPTSANVAFGCILPPRFLKTFTSHFHTMRKLLYYEALQGRKFPPVPECSQWLETSNIDLQSRGREEHQHTIKTVFLLEQSLLKAQQNAFRRMISPLTPFYGQSDPSSECLSAVQAGPSQQLRHNVFTEASE